MGIKLMDNGKGKYWVQGKYQKFYFNDIEEARWFVSSRMGGLATIHESK